MTVRPVLEDTGTDVQTVLEQFDYAVNVSDDSTNILVKGYWDQL